MTMRPSSDMEPDLDSNDDISTRPVNLLETPFILTPFILTTNWIGEKQYESDMHKKLMALNHGTVVQVKNIFHPEFWRDDINSADLTDYIVPFCPVRFSSKIFKFLYFLTTAIAQLKNPLAP